MNTVNNDEEVRAAAAADGCVVGAGADTHLEADACAEAAGAGGCAEATATDTHPEAGEGVKATAAGGDDREVLMRLAVEDAARALGVSDEALGRALRLCGALCGGEVSEEAARVLLAGITAADTARDAEQAGYLRGRNEKISLTAGFDNAPARVPVTPRYVRRSVWGE